MGWLLRHNWLWALLAFALGALITWFLVRRDHGQDRKAGQDARAKAEKASAPVQRREPVLVGAGGGAGVGAGSAGPPEPAEDDREPAHTAGEPINGEHEPMGNHHEAMSTDGQAVLDNREPAADHHEPVRSHDGDESGADRWREPMHETWELGPPDHDQPGGSEHHQPREVASQHPAPVSPVPSVDPASEFSERMDNFPAPDPTEDGPAAHAVPVNGEPLPAVPLDGEPADDVPPHGVLMDGEMGLPAGAGEVPPGRYGEGSADALPHQSAPDGYTIKGNEQSMQFHTPDSPYYGRTRPQVWFRTEADAERAGFTKYAREPHPLGH